MKKRWISAASESDTDSGAVGAVGKTDVEGEMRLDDTIAAVETASGSPLGVTEVKEEEPKQLPQFVAITENEFADENV